MPHTVIALHCWASSGCEYDLVRALLPPGTRLLAPDLPGFGGQPAPAGFDYSVRAYADWLADFVAPHDIGDFCLVGHSMSGKMALALAARHPAGLQRLVLLSPSPPPGEPMSDVARAALLAAFGKPEEAVKTFDTITRRPIPAALRAHVIADNLRTTRPAWVHWLREGTREDISALMPRLQVPCRLLVGDADPAITPATQRELTLPLLPVGTSFTVVPGAGHLLPLEAAAEVVEAIMGRQTDGIKNGRHAERSEASRVLK